MENNVIRYYAKVDARGRTSYFSSGGRYCWGHIRTPDALGSALKNLLRRHLDAQLMNGPEPDWENEYHSDNLGEYKLRELTRQEEQKLLGALHSAAKA